MKHAGLNIYSEAKSAKSARRSEESKSTHIRAESLAQMVAHPQVAILHATLRH